MDIYYDQIIRLSQDWPIRYQFGRNRQLVMIDTNHPEFSTAISESEFLWLKKCVLEMNIQRGFEVATGFGISSLAAGLSLKKTGGKLVTMDAHNEEGIRTYLSTDIRSAPTEEAPSLKSIKQLVEYFKLEENIFPVVGWSPQDTNDRINSVFGKDTELDYVFIDAWHTNEASMNDFNAIKDRLNKKHCLVAFRDYHDLPETVHYVEDFIGAKAEIDFPPPFGQNMAIIKRRS